MKTSSGIGTLKQVSFCLLGALGNALLATLMGSGAAAAPITPGELVAPQFEIVGGALNFTVQPSVAGRSYQLQYSETLTDGTWIDLGGVVIGDGNNLGMTTPHIVGSTQRFFRLALDGVPVVPEGFALIPAGSFQMGDPSNPRVGFSDERPLHIVSVSAFYMAKHEVTKELWDSVRAWGLLNGYTDLPVGNGSYVSKGANHPVHSITWYAMVKWCNARSQMEDLSPCYTVGGATYKTGSSAPDCDWGVNGYRLPSEAEWEKAARGGLGGQNFAWGNMISHSLANFRNEGLESYQTGTTGPHPVWSNSNDLNYPYSSSVGSFAANGYGLYDMAGNMWEWTWDWYDSYLAGGQTDPHGPPSGSYRVIRGGGWDDYANDTRCSSRGINWSSNTYFDIGFRLARGRL